MTKASESNLENHSSKIAFKMDGDWDVEDLINFVTKLSTIYNVLLAIKIQKKFTGKRPIKSLSIYYHLDHYVTKKDHLQVDKIQYGSPGIISFEGIGDVIKELRELIKDLLYRNKEESYKGNLDIIEKYLKIDREFPGILPPIQSIVEGNVRLVNLIDKNVEGLKQLQKDEKIEYLPPPIQNTESETSEKRP